MVMQQFTQKKSKSWTDAKVNVFDDTWDACLKPLRLKYEDNDYIQIRLLGDYFSAARIWVKFLKQDKNNTRDPNAKIPGAYAEWCIDYDIETEKLSPVGQCPYRNIAGYKPQIVWMGACIDRKAQADKPANASKDWTPIRYYEFGTKIAKQISDIVMLNKHLVNGQKVAFGPEHPQYGLDISIIYKPKEKGPDRYGVHKMELTPLTEEEMFDPNELTEVDEKGVRRWYYGSGHYKFLDISKIYKPKPIETIMRDFNNRVTNKTLLGPDGEPFVSKNGIIIPATTTSLNDVLEDDDIYDADDDVPVMPKSGQQVQTPVAQTPVAQESITIQTPVAQTPVAQPAPVQPPVQPVEPVAPAVQPVDVQQTPVAQDDPRITPALKNLLDLVNNNPNRKEILHIIVDEDNELTPNCIGGYSGELKCFKCPSPIRLKCKTRAKK